MEQIISLLKEINIAQLLGMTIIFWFFYCRLDAKIEKGIQKSEDIERRLSDKIEDVDRRLCRIEGSLASQGHCFFH
jgi:hypothetical protein